MANGRAALAAYLGVGRTKLEREMLGKRLFVSGLIVMCLFALGHLGGFLQGARAARHDPSMADLTRAMKEYRTSLFGFHPSLLDFREYFSLNFSILLFLAAALGFASLAITEDPPSSIRALSLVYLIAFLLLLGTSLYFSVFQGILTCAVIAILFGLAWWSA